MPAGSVVPLGSVVLAGGVVLARLSLALRSASANAPPPAVAARSGAVGAAVPPVPAAFTPNSAAGSASACSIADTRARMDSTDIAPVIGHLGTWLRVDG